MRSSGRKEELKKALDSAESIPDTIKVFNEMKSLFEESELGMECFTVAGKIFEQGKNVSDQVLALYCGKRAYTILSTNFRLTGCGGSALDFFNLARLLGSICLVLGRYDESLAYLNCADKGLSGLDMEDNPLVLKATLYVQTELMNVKAAKGMRDEVVIHGKKVLEIQEKLTEEGSVGIGEAYKLLASAYREAFDLKSALLFCFKALDIYTKRLGSDSSEVGELKRSIALIYHDTGDTEKAFELNQEAIPILEATGSLNLHAAVADCANMLIDLGKYDQAMSVLKGVKLPADVEGRTHVRTLMIMARASWFCGKVADAEEYLSKAQIVLEEKKMDSVSTAVGYADLSSLYFEMNNFETAKSLLMKSLASPKLPVKLLDQLCARILPLFFKSEKVTVSDIVENLKVSFGPKHFVVGFCYSSLGRACMESRKYELSAKVLAGAKDILDLALGPHNLISLRTSLELSEAYAQLGRYREALEIAEKVVEGLKDMETSEPEFEEEAIKHMSFMQERAAESQE